MKKRPRRKQLAAAMKSLNVESLSKTLVISKKAGISHQ